MPPRGFLQQRLSALPTPLAAALWMLVASLLFAGLSALIRYLGQNMHPFEVAFFRNLFGLAFMLPWLMRIGFGILRTQRFGLYLSRSGLSLVSMLCWFSALPMLPFEQAVALSFTAPLFATMGAALILRETVRARRWTATVLGFIGVLIILRPGFANAAAAGDFISLGAFLAIASAMVSAGLTLIVKDLARTEASDAVVTYMVLLLTPMSLVPALFVWQWPPLAFWPLLLAMGALGSAGHMCYMRSLARADASAVLPYDYTRLLFAALLGYFAFNEVPDLWTWAGAALIAGSAIYIAHRESLHNQSTAAEAGAGAGGPAIIGPPGAPEERR
jgi:drug/metabolite transporter (DMT)-like permease